MKINIKTATGLLLFFGAIIIFLMFFRGCQNPENGLIDLKNSLISKIGKFTTAINSAGQKITTQEQIITTQKEAIILGLTTKKELEENNLKSVQAIIRLKDELRIVNKQLQYADSPVVIRIHDTIRNITDDYIKVPLKAYLNKDKWFSIAETVTRSGINIDSLLVRNNEKITLGMQRKKGIAAIFSRGTPVVFVTSDNPYMQIKEMSNVMIKEKPKFYERHGVWFVAGIISGILILNSVPK
jgi:hypothetical protein